MDEVLEKPPRKRRFQKRPKDQIRRIDITTERIKRILFLLREYRFLTRGQIEEALFWHGFSRQQTGRYVSYLHDLDFVDMPEEQWPYRIGQGGSQRDIFALGNKGAQYLEDEFGIPQSSARWRDKNREAGHRYIKHALLVAEGMLAFERSCARRDDVRLIYPSEILEFADEKVREQPKPFQWQVEVEWEGIKLVISVQPDFTFGLEFLRLPPSNNKIYFTFEDDIGTEAVLPKNRKKVKKTTPFHKYLGYYGTYKQQLHKKLFNIDVFRVLTLTQKSGLQFSRNPRSGEVVSRTRVQSLQEAAMLASGGDIPHLFLFADLATFKRQDDVLKMPWKTAHPKKTAILDLEP